MAPTHSSATTDGSRLPRALRWLSVTLVIPLVLIVGLFPPGQTAQADTWTPVSSDDFTRNLHSGWGSTSSGDAWALSVPSSAMAWVAGGGGFVSRLTSGNRFVASLPRERTDIRATSSVTITQAPQGVDLLHTWRVRETSTSYYAITYRTNMNGKAILSVSRVIKGVSTWLYGKQISEQAKSGSTFQLETEVTGTDPVSINARLWLDGDPAPDWQISYKDSDAEALTNAGRISMDDYVNSGTSVTSLRFDDVSVETNSVTPTPTPTPTASPSPSAPSVDVTLPTDPDRGAQLGSTSYEYSDSAVFVSPQGSDSAAGTESSPLKTVAAALSKVPQGGTVVLRAGVYHESVETPYNRSITIQNYPKETVWFDGSTPVTNWTKSGTTWVSTGWKTTFSNTMGGQWSRYVHSSYPMSRYPDQVFIGGTALTQVGSAAEVKANTFFVDTSGQRLIIGSDPTGKEVRASDLAQAIRVLAPNVTLQGFGVRRYATPYESRGAIQVDPEGGVYRQLVIEDNATIGIALSKAGKTVDHLTVRRNGLLGIGGHKVDNLSLTNSVVTDNNSEHFNTEPVAGGIKVTTSTNVTIRHNTVTDNRNSTGIWLDEFCSDFAVTANTLTDNGANQIEVEISSRGVVANNLATGGKEGVNIYNTDKIKVFNNQVGGQSKFGIAIHQDARYKTMARDGFTLVVKDVTIANNLFGCGKLFQFYALDGETNIPASAMNITINGNLFSKRMVTTDPTMVALGGSDNSSLTRFETPATLASGVNSSWKNAQTTGCSAASTLKPQLVSAQGVAVALPTDVATALDRAPGLKQVGLVG